MVTKRLRGTKTPDAQKIVFPAPAKPKKTDTSGLINGTYLGARFEDYAGADGAVTAFLPIELEVVRPIAVQFYQDTQVPQGSSPGTPATNSWHREFSLVPSGDPGSGRISSTLSENTNQIRISRHETDPVNPVTIAAFVAGHQNVTGRLEWGSLGSSYAFTVAAINESDPDYWVLSVTSAVPDIADVPDALPQTFTFEFNATTSDGDPGAQKIAFNATLDAGPIQVYVSKSMISGPSPDPVMNLAYLYSAMTNLPINGRVSWGDDNYYRFELASWTELADHLQLEISLVELHIADVPTEVEGVFEPDLPEADDPIVLSFETVTPDLPTDSLPITFRLDGQTASPPANAGVRARVVYTAAKSGDVTFDCDWAGGFVVHARRVDISRVNYRPDLSSPYANAQVRVAATAVIGGPEPRIGPTLTISPTPVAVNESVLIPIPSFARKLRLLLRYGQDEDLPGDAPLGQLFVTFNSKLDHPQHWIDAMSAREALFGDGLPVPFGVSSVALSNRSDDGTVELGAVWVLGI